LMPNITDFNGDEMQALRTYLETLE
jgi:hypothetical protein